MAFWNRRASGRSIEPDVRGVFPTHVPVKTLDNQELMAMFKKDIGGAPAGGLYGGFSAYRGSYLSHYRTGPTRMAKLEEAYGGTVDSVTWAFACISLIASTAAAYPWRLTGNDGTTIEPEKAPQDLVTLLERPNDEWTYFDFIEAVATDLELVGNCYMLRNELNGLRQPKSLIRLRPERVIIALNPDGTKRGYVYTVQNGLQIPYDVDEIMHFKYPSPLDQNYGMGTVEAIAPLVDRQVAMSGHITGFFQNGARISGVLTVPQTMSDVSYERLKQTYQEQFAGSAAAYKMLIAEGAVDYKPITQGPAAAGTVELQQAAKDEILSAFGVPEFLMGGAHQAGVEKMEEAQNIFLRAMVPKARRIAERITNDLVAYWGLDFRIDPHANEPLSVRIEYAKAMIGAGARINEAREAMGLPLDDSPLADKILVPSNMIPLEIVGLPPRPAPSMPMDMRGESGATAAALPPGSPAPTLEEQIAAAQQAIANGGKDTAAIARLSETLRTHQRLLEGVMGKSAGSGGDSSDDDGSDDEESDREVPPGPWQPIPALIHRIERNRDDSGKGAKYSPDEPRDDHGRWTGGGGGDDATDGGGMELIRRHRPTVAASLRSRQLAAQGKAQLDTMMQNSAPIQGLNDNWDSIKSTAYEEAQKSWGGVTVNAHTGEALASNADMYALTVKPPGVETVSVPETATAEEFAQAMDTAKTSFGSELQQGNRYLGVFHDDQMGNIQIDPVVVVDSRDAVDTIGAYTHAVGGAYHFKSGDGFWPPHVGEGKQIDALKTIEEALAAWGTKSQTVTSPRTWTPPQLPRGFEPIIKATTVPQQDMRDVQAAALRKGYDVFEPVFRQFFRGQRNRVVEALSAYGSTHRSARLRNRPSKAKDELSADVIFNTGAENQALLDVYLPAVDTAIEDAVSEIPNAADLAAVDPGQLIEQLRDKLAGQVVRINETTRQAISDVVVEGLRRGYSIPQIANGYSDEKYPGIMGVFDDATDARAETIARTESAYAFNGVQAQIYEENGVQAVEIMDGTEWDEACADADGQIWSLAEYQANPIEHPNCTRSAVPSDQELSDGGNE